MMSPSTLWRLSEGDDDDEGGEKRASDNDDDTDRAVDESLSTDDDLLEVKREIAFTLHEEESGNGSGTEDGKHGGRKRRNTVRKASDSGP